MREPNRGALDTFRASRARREAFDAMPGILHDGGRRPKEARKVRAPVDPVLSEAKRPEIRKERPLSLDETRRGATCKGKPRDSRGSGGSRAFIPWCDRKG